MNLVELKTESIGEEMKRFKTILILLLMLVLSAGCIMIGSGPEISMFCTHDNESNIGQKCTHDNESNIEQENL